MDQSKQPPVTGVVNGTTQMAYAPPTYQQAGMVAAGPAIIGSMPPGTQLTAALSPNAAQLAGQHQLSYQQVQQFHHQHQQEQLQAFWTNQITEIDQTTDFKNQSLPLARIKKIMKADEDVRMISAEAPVVFAKACELFILELTLRAWIHTEENKRRTLQKNDIAAAISRTDIFDFLVDIVPRDELKEESLGLARAALPAMGTAADSAPYYYVPGQHPVPPHGMIVGKPVDQTSAAATYAAQQFHPVYMWQQPQMPMQQPPPQDQNVPESD